MAGAGNGPPATLVCVEYDGRLVWQSVRRQVPRVGLSGGQFSNWGALMGRLLVGLGAWIVLSGCTGAPQPRRLPIGEVLGQRVFREEIVGESDRELSDALRRRFLPPLAERYRATHGDELTPTEAEISYAVEHLRHPPTTQPEADRQPLRDRLAKVEARLAERGLAEDERESLARQEVALKRALEPPGREFATWLLSRWKFERHLYEAYGGGRILFQQTGYEAFDAMRRWLEDQEKQGAFRIADPRLRALLFHYWTTLDHGAFLTDNEETIRTEFLHPRWALTRTDTPDTSHPAMHP